MNGNHCWPVIAARALASGLAILAGSTHVLADWPAIWRGSSAKQKPDAARIANESRRRSGLSVVAAGPRVGHDRVAAGVPIFPAKKRTADGAHSEQSSLVLPIPTEAESVAAVQPIANEQSEPSRASFALPDLITLGLSQNPRLSKVSFEVEAARGRAHQAGLYPNPNVALMWDELGDRTGPSGINSLPQVTQEIVTGRKLKLSRSAAEREVEQLNWNVTAERYALLAEIRTAYFDALALQERVRLLRDIHRTGRDIAETVRRLRDDAKQLADIDVLPVEAEFLRYEADLESAEAEQAAAYKRLAAVLGVHRLSITEVAGRFEDFVFPDYSVDTTTPYVLSVHPEIHAAQWGVEKARLMVQRAKVEPIPNVSVSTGYVRQNQNRSDDYMLGASASIPLWNRNQGQIRAAEAELCSAMQDVARVENDLSSRVASALRDYSAARTRAGKYTQVVEKTEQAQAIADADRRRNLSSVMVLELQRSQRQARLERLRSLGDAWKAAASISGLALEDHWPPTTGDSTTVVPPVPAVDDAK